MERPKLDKPTKEVWKSSDKLYAKIINHITKQAFDINNWNFKDPTNPKKTVSYSKIRENIRKDYPDKEWLDALRTWFDFMPQRLDLMRMDFEREFRNLTERNEEQINFIKKSIEYTDYIEKRHKKLKEAYRDMSGKMQLYKLQEKERELQAREEELKNMRAELKGEIESIRKYDKPDKPKVPAKPVPPENLLEPVNDSDPKPQHDFNTKEKNEKPESFLEEDEDEFIDEI